MPFTFMSSLLTLKFLDDYFQQNSYFKRKANVADGSTIKLAVLIDADNAPPSAASLVLAEVAKYGTVFVKRAYGDWTGTNLRGWKEHLLHSSIQPIQQFAYTKGKNATDAAMIIDAMDLLYSNRFDGFCLVSSDSDFTRLASRVRESGLVVYGCGERKTPQPFVTACDKFIYTENLVPLAPTAPIALMAPGNESSEQTGALRIKQEAPSTPILDSSHLACLRSAIRAYSDEDGWAPLDRVGQFMTRTHPDFDHRTYGYQKLSKLCDSLPAFVVARIPRDGKETTVHIRERKQSDSS
ncbi:hypothetical protein FZEAL_8965 [Fusarium zealandicum]|uniref:HTH OST-type domain-containing protein n=1 Tax=Fusarium zealandicum TaxID=1053134 RepID=A0A8H4UCW2_9HYPO|nr:hypothetical protein FZEAL_8965 [Fusarium zealandicum]